MPDIIKIGRTSLSVSERMVSLDNTSVPLPFECYYAARVSDSPALEKALHIALGEHRVRNSREFFKIDPIRAKVILELLAIEDATPGDLITESPQDVEDIERSREMRPAFRFSLAGVPIGATLEFVKDQNVTAKVVSDKAIEFRGERTSLSKAALTLVHELGYSWRTLNGTLYWMHEGLTLDEKRKITEGLASPGGG
jgi:hypothetical protein